MEMPNFSHFAWKSLYDPNTKNVRSKSINSAMDKNGNPTVIGKALLNGLRPDLVDCNRGRLSWEDLPNGAYVFQTDDGGYYDECTLEYLGHETLVEGRKNDKIFDPDNVPIYEEEDLEDC